MSFEKCPTNFNISKSSFKNLGATVTREMSSSSPNFESSACNPRLILKENSKNNNNNFQPNFQQKLVIVGDENVGKTSIIENYRGTEFAELSEVKNLFADITTNLNLPSFRLKQPVTYEYATTPNWLSQYFNNTSCVLIVFDVNDLTTLKSACGRWLMRVRELFPKVPVILVGNKIDVLKPMKKLKIGRANRQGSPIIVEALAIKFGFNDYMEIASNPQNKNRDLDGSLVEPKRNMDKLFNSAHHLASEYVNNRKLPLFAEKILPPNLLQQLTDKFEDINLKVIGQKCQTNNNQNKTSKPAASIYRHDLLPVINPNQKPDHFEIIQSNNQKDQTCRKNSWSDRFPRKNNSLNSHNSHDSSRNSRKNSRKIRKSFKNVKDKLANGFRASTMTMDTQNLQDGSDGTKRKMRERSKTYTIEIDV